MKLLSVRVPCDLYKRILQARRDIFLTSGEIKSTTTLVNEALRKTYGKKGKK